MVIQILSQYRHMYWTDWGDVAKIERASMDGSDRRVLVSTELVWPNAITLDYQTKTLYWADAYLDKIESSDTEGLNRAVITESHHVRHPFAITVFSGTLYWSEWAYKRILLTQINGNVIYSLTYHHLPEKPMSLHVITGQRQPAGDMLFLF